MKEKTSWRRKCDTFFPLMLITFNYNYSFLYSLFFKFKVTKLRCHHRITKRLIGFWSDSLWSLFFSYSPCALLVFFFIIEAFLCNYNIWTFVILFFCLKPFFSPVVIIITCEDCCIIRFIPQQHLCVNYGITDLKRGQYFSPHCTNGWPAILQYHLRRPVWFGSWGNLCRL